MVREKEGGVKRGTGQWPEVQQYLAHITTRRKHCTSGAVFICGETMYCSVLLDFNPEKKVINLFVTTIFPNPVSNWCEMGSAFIGDQ